MSTCTYCGKELSGLKHIKNVTYFELYGREFCFECYGYAAMFCTSPDDIDRFTIEELKAICNHDDCDICGKKAGKTIAGRMYVRDGMICTDCVKNLRPFYAIDPDEKKAAAIVNAVGMAVIAAADLNVTPETVEANDPLKMATISELKEKYESEIQVK